MWNFAVWHFRKKSLSRYVEDENEDWAVRAAKTKKYKCVLNLWIGVTQLFWNVVGEGTGGGLVFETSGAAQSAASRHICTFNVQHPGLPPPLHLLVLPMFILMLVDLRQRVRPDLVDSYHPSESRQKSKQPTGDTSIHRLKEYKFHRFFGGVNLEVDWSDSPSQTFLHHALTLLSSVHWQSPHSASRVALIL